MKETKLPCGTRVTAEIMKSGDQPDDILIGVDIEIYSKSDLPQASFFIARASMVEAVRFLRETAEDYWEEEKSCSS